MIDIYHLTFFVSVGASLIALGLVPHLFERLIEAIHNQEGLFFPRIPMLVRQHRRVRQPTSLAGFGIALIVASTLIYLSN